MTTPAIPGWEWSELNQLSDKGELSGVSPTVIGSIDQAESSGSGGGINSSGYGGWFGLSATSHYPGEPGKSTPGTALLESTSVSSFVAQAQIAASEFAALLTGNGGDPIKAEEAYQSGSASGPTEGSRILAKNLGLPAGSTSAPAFLSSGGTGVDTQDYTPPATSSPSVPNPTSLVTGGIADIVGTLISPLKAWIEDAGLIFLGVVIIIVGLVLIAHAGLDAGTGSSKGGGSSSRSSTSSGPGPAKRSQPPASSSGSENRSAANDAESGVKSGVNVAEVAAAA